MSKQIIKNILEFSKEIKISKEGKNNFLGSSYFKPSQMENLRKQFQEKYNCYIIFETEDVATNVIMASSIDKEGKIKPEKPEYYVSGILVGTIIPQNDEETLTIRKPVGASSSDLSFADGSMITYGKRYWLMDLFSIVDDNEDPEHNNNTKQVFKKEDGKATDKQKMAISNFISKNKVLADSKGYNVAMIETLSFNEASEIITFFMKELGYGNK